MASHTRAEPAKMEQIITEFFAKSLHIVLESRSPYVSSRHYSGEQMMSSPSPSSSSSSFSSIRPRDKWFNLALRDCSVAFENIDFSLHSNLEPLVVDVILRQRPCDSDEFSKTEKIIERWFMQYETHKNNSKRSNCTSSSVLYKKSILLLRSLYATVRLLPAYQLFRDLSCSGQIQEFNLAHRVSSFSEPLTLTELSELTRFAFTPVETSCGRLSISVLYTSSLFDLNSQPTTPISPRFIPNYLSSPMADPVKRFFLIQSPPLDRFERRHSWSYDIHKASPPFVIPSPTYSDSHATFSRRGPYNNNNCNLPPRNSTDFDEYLPSPNFSPSPSASPPNAYIRGGCIPSVSLLRTESDPLSAQFKPNLPISPTVLGASRLGSKSDQNLSLVHYGSTADKAVSGKDEAGKLYGLMFSSNSSLQRSFSRSSSRLSYQADNDETVFSGPFVVDDDDVADPAGTRPYEVGELVHMLKKAPPLHRQDISSASHLTQDAYSKSFEPVMLEAGLGPNVSVSSSRFTSKTASDALQELKGYKDMKDVLLKQSGKNV